MLNAGTYTSDDLRRLGVGSVGENVRVHRTVQIFGEAHLRIGPNVRIDAQAVLSAGAGGMTIGSNVHIGVGVTILGSGGTVTLEDFCGISPRCTLFTATDDFVGGALTGPTVPDDLRAVKAGAIRVGRHAVIGASSVVLPGVTINIGATVGALSLVTLDAPEFAIIAGVPARQIGTRSRRVLELEAELHARSRK